MEADEQNIGNNLKRQRAPLSDSEDNIPITSEGKDGQKRRRMDAVGQENHSPMQSTSGNHTETGPKPDTPFVPSVQFRVQQLIQSRGGGTPLTQRCLSDPGADSPSTIFQDKGFREQLLGKGEFSQRLQKFKVSICQSDSAPSPANPCLRTCSNFVSGIHQKLQDSPTSSEQASRIRQEREKEFSRLHFQPIRENPWLKRSSSDSSLNQVETDAAMKEGSFPEAPTLDAKKPSTHTTGKVAACDAEDPTASSSEGQLQMEWRKKYNCQDEEVRENGKDYKASPGNKQEHIGSQQPESQTVLKLSFCHDVELSSHDETNTAEILDQMFDEVLEYAGRMGEDKSDDEDAEDRDSGIVACPGDKDKTDLESEKEESQEGTKEACDELLNFPPSGILSPLSKSVESVVTPMRLAVSQESNAPLLLLTSEEITTPPAESTPLYSIDAYRTQRQSKLPTIQSVTPGVQRQAPEKSSTQQPVNTKERIVTLNEEAVKLQIVINQTLQALSCCTDEEHGQGSLQEAEAEKLLLVSCEKREALLAEMARLREERNSESVEVAKDDREYVSQPCRGTVSITNIQLPVKVEFVCSSHRRTGQQSHYFFVLVRYGPCNIVATQLATAADSQNGDTISFPTSVTLKDIRSSFEIDVEVYSLSHTGNNCSIDRVTTKSRVTPRKLLNTITRSSNTLASAVLSNLNARRSSNFCLVGCHKITLASLGHSKFPLDKMRLEGKIRRLLGNEFQEKVPFLSPLEGNIYLKLHSESHSNVQHQGFLTMFELISGYGVWHRCFFVLEKCNMYYWNHPNDKETKEAEGSICLSSSPSQCVRPVKRDSCARPFTFELVSNIPHQQQDRSKEALAKCWFSADTKEERLEWMEKLNQALLDFHTWNRTSECGQSNTSNSDNLRESIP